MNMELRMIPIDKIQPSPFQPRETFEKESIRELADSIEDANIIQPIVVRKLGDVYQIIAGERRWRAAKLVGLRELPCIVKDIAENRVLLESVVENLHRKDLTDIERENAIHELWKSGLFDTKETLAKAIGVPKERVLYDIEAKEFRDAEKVSMDTSTEPSEEQEDFLSKKEKR